MDPGNWATDLAGGSSFGYMLLFVILLSNLMAVVLQGLAVKLGVVSGLGKSSICHWSRINLCVWYMEQRKEGVICSARQEKANHVLESLSKPLREQTHYFQSATAKMASPGTLWRMDCSEKIRC